MDGGGIEARGALSSAGGGRGASEDRVAVLAGGELAHGVAQLLGHGVWGISQRPCSRAETEKEQALTLVAKVGGGEDAGHGQAL